MQPIYNALITKLKNDNRFNFDDTLVEEKKLDIFVNKKLITSLMCTPVDMSELAIGYLMSEGIVKKIKHIQKIKQKNSQIFIKAKIHVKKATKLNTQGVIISGCGRSKSVSTSINDLNATKIKSEKKISSKILLEQMEKFYTQCPLYEQTGCVHTAKLYIDENTYYIGEDIAQHNTIDKAIAKAKMDKAHVKDAFLMVSGRLSSEMVAKAIMHKVPILVSRTATTSLGYKIAQAYGLTLVGFARANGMNIYTQQERIC